MILGLYLRHLKVYKGINFIPIGMKNFVSYLGENGSGKSSILESFNAFFNFKKYSINKLALKDGIHTDNNFPYFVPLLVIEKIKITRYKKEFESLSEYFWTVERSAIGINAQKQTADFFKSRQDLINNNYEKEKYYFLLIGENAESKNVYIHSFQRDTHFLKYIDFNDSEENYDNKKEYNLAIDKYVTSKYKNVLDEIKKLYSYVYIPVEIDVEDFTKIETDSMQKIFGKSLKEEILNLLDQQYVIDINNKLNEFVEQIEHTLEGKYYYDSEVGNTSKKYLKNTDLFEKILEVYFKIRVLNKGNSNNRKLSKKISELSAGEKRQALINLVYAFLSDQNERDGYIIIGIDEPENSLHTSLCYEQFEKLKEISENCQVLITTHWYGFLPIISNGYGHFLNKKEDDEKADISFTTYDLYGYKADVRKSLSESKNSIPDDFQLKSMNDLVQSIFYSIRQDNSYNWLVCEGISEKIYFEYFLQDEIKNCNLNIIPMGGQKEVSKLYEYLEVPIRNEAKSLNGKVYCIIDTDVNRHKEHLTEGYDNLKIRRLSNNESKPTELITLNHSYNYATEIENALNPEIFKEVITQITNDNKYSNINIYPNAQNTDFIKCLKNYELREFFNLDSGNNKITFAKKYIEIMQKKENCNLYIPNWINDLKDFFRK